jgi:hypothetical protein
MKNQQQPQQQQQQQGGSSADGATEGGLPSWLANLKKTMNNR